MADDQFRRPFLVPVSAVGAFKKAWDKSVERCREHGRQRQREQFEAYNRRLREPPKEKV